MPDSKEYGVIEQSTISIFDPQFFPRPQGEKKLGWENAHQKNFFVYFLFRLKESKCPRGISAKVEE